MEDADTTVLDLIPSPSEEESKTHGGRLSFFGVFDGHGGDKVATFCGNNLQNILLRQESFKKGNYVQGLKDGFLAVDRAMLGGTYFCDLMLSVPRHSSQSPKLTAHPLDPKFEDEVSGCTACVSLIAGNKVYVVCCVTRRHRQQPLL